MVFCGRPSRGCATCRAKKKKCDEAIPACSLCKRTGATCPGYRDKLALSFRDQTQHTIRNLCRVSQKTPPSIEISTRQSKGSPASAPDSTHPVLEVEVEVDNPDLGCSTVGRRESYAFVFENSHDCDAPSVIQLQLSCDLNIAPDTYLLPDIESSSSPLETSPAEESIPTSYVGPHIPAISPHLSPSVEDQAKCFFFQNYVFIDPAIPYGPFARLSTAIFGQAEETKALSGVVISIGAAGISNIHRDPDLMHKAQEFHASTLKRTQKLLEDSSRIQEDQTLLVVLLLAVYENVTCCTPQSLRSWSRHVRGATALLSHRSQDALNDISLLELFIYLRQQIITDCLQRRVCVPQIIADWSQNVKNVVSEHRLWQNPLEEIAIRLCRLRSSIKLHNIDGIEAIREAMSIDEDLENWLSNFPAEFSYATFYDFESPEEVFLGCYHVYPDMKVAIVCNYYRSLRILTNEATIDALNSRGSVSPNDSQRLAAEQMLKKLTADICASVPPFLGYQNCQKSASVVVGTLLLWPLYTCAAQNYVSPMTRNWVMLQFEKIGETMGIRLATSLAEVLRAKGEVTVWDRTEAAKGQDLYRQVAWDNLEEW